MFSRKLLILLILVVISVWGFVIWKNLQYDQPRIEIFPKIAMEDPPLDFQHNPSHPITNFSGNIPDIYLDDKLKKPSGINKTCAKFPDFFDLRFESDYWQKQKTSNNRTLHLFNAYTDTRNGSFVRIVALYDVNRPEVNFYCQYWYPKNNVPKIVKSQAPFWLYLSNWGADNGYFHQPYLISCPLELEKGQLPVSVSLVENPCDCASNNLKLFNRVAKQKKNFVVCVKGLSFPFEDLSARLAEWIELLHLLGAEKINFYEFSVHTNVQKVLDYYVDEGLVEVTPITIVGDYSNHPFFQNKFLHKQMLLRRLQEVIPYNDCLYKHLEEFKYVVILDTDEIIVPVNDTWIELLEILEEQLPGVSSYMARNVYFLDSHLHQHEWFSDIPQYMHMLQHVYRAKEYTKPGYFVKGFHNTAMVAALHNHYPFLCLYKGCIDKEIDLSLAHLQHYRKDCVSGVSACDSMKKDSVMDTRVWRFKKELIERVIKVLEKTQVLEVTNVFENEPSVTKGLMKRVVYTGFFYFALVLSLKYRKYIMIFTTVDLGNFIYGWLR